MHPKPFSRFRVQNYCFFLTYANFSCTISIKFSVSRPHIGIQ